MVCLRQVERKQNQRKSEKERQTKPPKQHHARESLVDLQTTVRQNSPLTTALQSQRGPCQHSVSFLIGNLRFLDPKISTCYGCRQPLKPNQSIPREPDDLVIVGRARREYWKNGEKVISSELSNVYFHINPSCVAVKNAFFVPGLVQIPTDLKPFLKESHKRELKRELNLNFITRTRTRTRTREKIHDKKVNDKKVFVVAGKYFFGITMVLQRMFSSQFTTNL